ncbi:hypothetical protein [Microbacterium timonense]|uniref:hypothetical protein n=1 Tax=Microbacterium timonense TaxID=2086576 RepID=UPI000D0F2DEC|nr:hypothetical protein [Microbacterium timonense]
MTASASTATVGEQLADALATCRADRESAERALRVSIAKRSRAGVELERTAGRRDLSEDDRARLRAAHAEADRAVARCRDGLERTRELERAARIVAAAFEAQLAADPLAAALAQLSGQLSGQPAGARAAGHRTRTVPRPAAPLVRLRSARRRTA